MRLSYEKLADWLVPAMLGALVAIGGGVCGVLMTISATLGELKTVIAVANSRVDHLEQDHGRRLDNVEAYIYNGAVRSSRGAGGKP